MPLCNCLRSVVCVKHKRLLGQARRDDDIAQGARSCRHPCNALGTYEHQCGRQVRHRERGGSALNTYVAQSEEALLALSRDAVQSEQTVLLARPTFHYWAPVGVSCRERITSSTVTGTLPAARWMSMARTAGQCHTLYMMPTRLHRTRLPAASSCTCTCV